VNPDKIKALVEMQDPVQELQGESPLSTDSFLELLREACLSFKFSEVLRTLSGLRLKSGFFKNSKTICRI
jgi:hypothetical protein